MPCDRRRRQGEREDRRQDRGQVTGVVTEAGSHRRRRWRDVDGACRGAASAAEASHAARLRGRGANLAGHPRRNHRRHRARRRDLERQPSSSRSSFELAMADHPLTARTPSLSPHAASAYACSATHWHPPRARRRDCRATRSREPPRARADADALEVATNTAARGGRRRRSIDVIKFVAPWCGCASRGQARVDRPSFPRRRVLRQSARRW